MTYAATAHLYLAAGWTCVLPVPPGDKHPPPVGFTGAHGVDTSPEQVAAWARERPESAVALRMPDGVIGIDVDEYVTASGVVKHGAATLLGAEARWGPLPSTWSSTARGPGPSRISFYRVPAGRYITALRPDVEIIQRHHRYAVVWPSPHAAGTYTWYNPHGAGDSRIPGPAHLAELPAAWVAGLAEGAAEAGPAPASYGAGESLLARLRDDNREPCAEMYDAKTTAIQALVQSNAGSRHDTVTPRVHHIVMLGGFGHPGAGPILAEIEQLWEQLTSEENRSSEFQRMLLGSARKAVTATFGANISADPCTMMGGAGFANVAVAVAEDARTRPTDVRPPDTQHGEPLPALPPHWADPSWAQMLGTEPFRPEGTTDHALADAMLARAVPAVRRLSNGSQWLLRGVERWQITGDLSGRIVKECVEAMPVGDNSPPALGEDPTPAQEDAKRRKRLLMNAGANAVAASIRRATDGGRHPLVVDLAQLDQDPEILWAGGWPFDLRASTHVPTVARHVDPFGPHLMSAGVTPDASVPTPRWDAFLAAVWPDPAVRAWCLRVLSISLTGYADAALPVLFGEGGTGKSSIAHLFLQLLGNYAVVPDPAVLGDKSNGFHVYSFKGARFAFIDEAMRDSKAGIEVLKQLTGGTPLTGSAKNQDEVTFDATHTLVLTSNTPPVISDAALRRRVRVLPCLGDPVAVRETRQRLTGPWWAAEAPGVLAALMREAAAWLADPDSALTERAPLDVQVHVGALVAEQDHVARWVEDATVPDHPGTRARDLFVAFRGWCRDGGIPERNIPTETAFGRKLTELGHPASDHRDGRRRPLRIRSGDSLGPWTPPSGGVEGSPPFVVSSGGSAPQPSTPRNPTSNPVSPVSVEGVEGLSPKGDSQRETDRKINKFPHGVVMGGEQEHNPPHPETGGKNTPPPATMGVEGSPTPTHHTPSAAVERVFALGLTITPGENPAAADVALAAERLGVRRPEARTLIKAAGKALALRQAAGSVLALPALVNRALDVTPVPVQVAGQRVLDAIGRSYALTVDVETSGYPVGHRLYALRSVQIGDEHEVSIFDPIEHGPMIRYLIEQAPALHAHSAPADLVPLAVAGLIDWRAAWAKMHDTVIPAKLGDPQSTGSDPGLKEISGSVLRDYAVSPAAENGRQAVFKAGGWLEKTKPDTPIERNGWAQIETGCETMIRYAGADVLDTAAIARVLRAQLPRPDVYERERLAQRLTAPVSLRGVRIDREQVRALTEAHTAAQGREAGALAAWGIDKPGSDPTIVAAFERLGVELPRTKPTRTKPQGGPSVAAAVIERLTDHPGDVGALAARVLEYRHHSTALSLFCAPYAALCDYGDGRARPTIYTIGTDTGRMSCVRPNMQQLSREGGVRAMITADPGFMMIGADFKNVELRVAAALSGDPNLTRMIAEGEDIHWNIARLVYGPQATKSHRYRVKRGVFGRLYGGGLATLADQMGVYPDVAQRMIDVLDSEFGVLSQWSEFMRGQVRAGNTQFPAYSGRIIHLPKAFPHKAPNYAIQGTARELLVDAMVKWAETPWADCTLLPVHDEVDVFVPEADAERATLALVECMATELGGVEIVADPAVPSFYWQDAA